MNPSEKWNDLEKYVYGEHKASCMLEAGGYACTCGKQEAAAELARITAERDAAISDLQDAVDFVYNVYGENNETLAAITTAHWRAVIADVKKSV